jgi:hypothetical protein
MLAVTSISNRARRRTVALNVRRARGQPFRETCNARFRARAANRSSRRSTRRPIAACSFRIAGRRCRCCRAASRTIAASSTATTCAPIIAGRTIRSIIAPSNRSAAVRSGKATATTATCSAPRIISRSIESHRLRGEPVRVPLCRRNCGRCLRQITVAGAGATRSLAVRDLRRSARCLRWARLGDRSVFGPVTNHRDQRDCSQFILRQLAVSRIAVSH